MEYVLMILACLGERMTLDRGEFDRDRTSEVFQVAEFNEAVISWNARVPAKGKLRVALRVRVDGEWLPWAAMGASDGGRLKSIPYKAGGPVKIAVDTLVLKGGKKADAFQYRLKMSGGTRVTLVAVAHYIAKEKKKIDCRHGAWGKVLKVPERSQMVEDAKIAGDICSPTSVSMVLEFHGIDRKTADVAAAVYDHGAKIYGNWPCNTAYAHRAGAGDAYVKKCVSLCEVEAEIAADRPVVLSHRWKKGELTNAPISRSSGHLIVVVGFTKEGDVVVNDPAANPRKGQTIRRTYKRAEIEHTWLKNAGGIVYIIHPVK